MIATTLRQKKGKYHKVYNDGIRDETRFYYFPYEKSDNLVLEEDNRSEPSKSLMSRYNYNTLELFFTNELENKVSVEFTYNSENGRFEGNKMTQIYQYKNKNWEKLSQDISDD